MSCLSPTNVIVVNGDPCDHSALEEHLPIERDYRSVVTPQLRSGVTLRDLIEREGEGS